MRDTNDDIRTGRLLLVPFTHDLVLAAMHDRAELARRLQVTLPDAWPGPDFGEILPLVARDVEGDPARAAWGRLVVHPADATLIGDAGFKAPPGVDGTAEIGYSIVPAYRGQGYATEAAAALIAWARARPGVTRIVAECLGDNAASIRVLEKLGMRRVLPPGDILKWELSIREVKNG